VHPPPTSQSTLLTHPLPLSGPSLHVSDLPLVKLSFILLDTLTATRRIAVLIPDFGVLSIGHTANPITCGSRFLLRYTLALDYGPHYSGDPTTVLLTQVMPLPVMYEHIPSPSWSGRLTSRAVVSPRCRPCGSIRH